MDIASGARPTREGGRRHHAVIDLVAPQVRFLAVAEEFGNADRRAPGAPEALTFARDYLRRQQRAGVFATLGGRSKIVQQLIIDALEFSNKRLYDRSGSTDDYIAGGIAVVGALIVGRHVVLAHAGDARAYIWRAGVLQAITKDDAVLVAAVPVDAEQAVTLAEPVRLLWRSLGTQSRLEAAVTVFDLLPDDRLCLCTSGVYRTVAHAGLTHAIGETPREVDALGDVRGPDGQLRGAAVLAFGNLPAQSDQLLDRFGRAVRPSLAALLAVVLGVSALLVHR